MATKGANPVTELIGRELTSVEFVRDYFQLRFDGPQLNVTTAATVETPDRTLRFPEPLFCSGMVSLIDQQVTSVQQDDTTLKIVFGKALLTLSLRPEDFHVEAYYDQASDGTFLVHN